MQDLLLISDLHLGAHLKRRGRGEFVHLAAQVDEDLARFLEHYMAERPEGGWQLVINGDFIDFWNVEVAGGELDAQARAVKRLHAVLDEYPAAEDALARFLRAGNGIVVVAGNHDAEFLYPDVREALARRIEPPEDASASITRTGAVRLDELTAGRVRFVRWFLREPGGAWIEHGHKFDPTCATPAALSPMRGGRLVQTVAEVATRSFLNLVPEIDHDAPDKMSGADYLRWAAARGVRFVVRAMLLYLRMVGRMIALWARQGRVDRKARAEHERRLVKVAQNSGLQMSTLMALERMAPPPSSMSVGGVLSVLVLDVILAALVPLLLVAGGLVWAGAPAWAALAVGAAAGALAAWRVASHRSDRNVARDMLEVAAGVGEVVGAPLVLMGHSHHGQLEQRGPVLYANSGSWLDGSHLVVHRDTEGRLAQVSLRRFRNGGVVTLRTAKVQRDPREGLARVSGAAGHGEAVPMENAAPSC